MGLGVVWYRVEKSISVAEAEYDKALRASCEEDNLSSKRT